MSYLTDTHPIAPALPGVPRHEDIHLPDGVRLRCLEQGDAEGPALVLLHGYSDSSFSFSRILPRMPRSLRVVAIDQRGHGGSDRPASGYAMRSLAADALGVMDALGIERATVVGHSMGSFVAQQVALAAPERVRGLVLVDSAPSVLGMSGFEAFASEVAGLTDPVPARFAREFQESTVHRPLPAEFMDRAIAESLRLPARVWRALLAGMIATQPQSALGATLAAARIPALVIWGDRDAIFERPQQDGLLGMLGGAATFSVYGETGHAPHWERPERFARELAAWV